MKFGRKDQRRRTIDGYQGSANTVSRRLLSVRTELRVEDPETGNAPTTGRPTDLCSPNAVQLHGLAADPETDGSITLSVTAEDGVDSAFIYSWDQVDNGAPKVELDGQFTDRPKFVPPAEEPETTYHFRVSAAGIADEKIVDVFVRVDSQTG